MPSVINTLWVHTCKHTCTHTDSERRNLACTSQRPACALFKNFQIVCVVCLNFFLLIFRVDVELLDQNNTVIQASLQAQFEESAKEQNILQDLRISLRFQDFTEIPRSHIDFKVSQ